MKAKIIFDLTDPDDRDDYARANKALDMALVLWEIQANIKKRAENWIDDQLDKPDPDDPISFQGVVDFIFKEIFDIMDEHDVNPDRLVT
jgi:hypothetical protein